VSDYGLDDRASPAGAEDFSCSLCVQIGSGAHPASYAMCTGGGGVLSPWVKYSWSVTLTTELMSIMISCISSPP
jgi:hypothetical protein